VIIEADLSAAEWRVAAFLSQDVTAIDEIKQGHDAHADNCVNVMGLPLTKNNRTDAKVFLFRILFGGTYMGMHKDPRMPNFSKTKWKSIIKNFYQKYIDLSNWHEQLIISANQHGFYTSPTGRILSFKKVMNKYSGVKEYPRGQILNYPVQSLAADIIHIAMIEAYQMVREQTTYTKFIVQVHDSMVWDAPDSEVEIVCEINKFVFDNLTTYIKKYYDFDFNVPLTGEICYGKDWGSTDVLYR